MANTIKIKRGLSTNISQLTLEPGEIAVVLDTRDLKVGNASGEVTGINAATATALQEAITINGVSFDGTSSINVMEAGDHVAINNSKINVVDIGDMETLATEARSTVVEAVNELVGDLETTTTVLTNLINNSNQQLNNRIDSIETNPEINVSSLTNSLMNLDEDMLSVGNDTTRLQMTNDGESFEIKNGAASVIQVGLNTQTNAIQTTVASLNVPGKADIGSHRQQSFTSNGKKRTGWFYNGGAN